MMHVGRIKEILLFGTIALALVFFRPSVILGQEEEPRERDQCVVCHVDDENLPEDYV